MNLARSYARVYKAKIKADIKKYGKEKAMAMWDEFKKELPQVHTSKFIKDIEREFNGKQ